MQRFGKGICFRKPLTSATKALHRQRGQLTGGKQPLDSMLARENSDLGVRAFGTQLLCEQVVGRGLRRQSYDLNEEGLFDVEYADILGIPFDFTAKPVVAPPKRPKSTVRVQALKERAKILQAAAERLAAGFGANA